MRVEFFWILDHIGIKGNEVADIMEKAGSHRFISNVNFTFFDDKAQMKFLVLEK